MIPERIVQFHIMDASPLRQKCMASMRSAYPEIPYVFWGPDNWSEIVDRMMRDLHIDTYPDEWNINAKTGRPALSDWIRYYECATSPRTMWADSDLLIVKRFDGWDEPGKPYFAHMHGGVIDSCWIQANGVSTYFEEVLHRRVAQKRFKILVNEFDGSLAHYIPTEHFVHYGCEHHAKDDPDPHWWAL